MNALKNWVQMLVICSRGINMKSNWTCPLDRLTAQGYEVHVVD
jgi:hypothetical protein